MTNQNTTQSVLEQPLKPTDQVQTEYTVEKLANAEPLEPQHERPDLVELTPAEVKTLPTNITK